MALTPKDLLRLLDYDPASGLLVWRYRPQALCKTLGSFRSFNTRMAGRPAFTAKTADGYLCGRIFDRRHQAHRVIWAMTHGEWTDLHIDHINGVRDDNRIDNLRAVTRLENQRNMAIGTANTSGVLGVSWITGKRKWRAEINDKAGVGRKYLGYFARLEDAAAARKHAEALIGYHPNHGRAKA